MDRTPEIGGLLPKNEIGQAEAALTNIAVVTYLPETKWVVLIHARDGTVIDDLLSATSIGPLQLH